MQLTRLQELLATTQEEARLEEGKKHYSDFNGMMRLVDDALGDLKDKLGKGGTLATLFKESGASKLDTVKDEAGKNVLNQIIATTTEYKRTIEKLLMEAEILISQIADDEPKKVLKEASEYDDSSEFTDEFYKMQSQIIDIKSKMKNPRWMSWMKATDSNFGTECEAPARSAIQAIGTLEAQMADIDAELDKAS